MSKLAFLILVVVALAAFYGGYRFGDTSGYERGIADAVKIQADTEAQTQVDTGYKNPYEEVKFNPFK